MNKIVEIKFGSWLYGTNTENSDVDVKGVYLPSVEDIILQRVKATISNKRGKEQGEKNLPGELDEEYFSLQRYLQLLAEGQTVALDMLFARPVNLIHSTYIWQEIISNKDKLISRKSTAFVGYCRQQANKYGIKGSRVAAVRAALGLTGIIAPGVLKQHWDVISDLSALNEHMQVINIEQADGNLLPHWEICGRKFSQTTSIQQVFDCLKKIMDNYGQRALAAEAQNGVDWKALSHAVRVANQAIELLDTGFVTFPLPNRAHILDIKLGKLPYQDVADEIEKLLEQVEASSERSSLPEHPDYDFIDQLVFTHYRNVNAAGYL